MVDSTDAMRVYVKPLDGSGAAVLRYTSALKTPPLDRWLSANLNADSTYMAVTDTWSGASKQIFVVNVATGRNDPRCGSSCRASSTFASRFSIPSSRTS